MENINQTITTRRIVSTGRRLFVKFRKRAGVDGRTFHDLRRSALSAIGNSGATNAEIVSFSGHKTLSDVTRYTEDANRADLAGGAVKGMDKKTT